MTAFNREQSQVGEFASNEPPEDDQPDQPDTEETPATPPPNQEPKPS